MFVERVAELRFLKERLRARGAQLVVVWGRRRIGKSALLTRFAEQEGLVYHQATRSTVTQELARFSERLAEHYRDPVLAAQAFASWDVAFRYLAEKKTALILDEFPYLAEADPSFPTVLQAAWDERLSKRGVRLFLCGSSVGMVERIALAHDAPLYGRRTGQWRVGPLAPWDLDAFVGGDLAAQIPWFATFGGVPHYLALTERRRSYARNVVRLALTPGSPLYEEIPFLLREEFREPRVYFAILSAIAAGAERFGEISSKTGVERANLTRYLGELAEMGLVRREVPITQRQPDKSRLGLHRILDPFTRFWFRFVHGNRDRLEMGDAEAVFRERIATALDGFVAPVAESVASDVLAARAGLVPFAPVFRGRHWSKDVDLDVVFLDEGRKHALVAEVKWQKTTPRAALLDDLRARTARVPEFAGCAITYALVTRTPGPLERKLRADERFVTFSGWRVGGRVAPGV